jgi:hypothetical protein
VLVARFTLNTIGIQMADAQVVGDFGIGNNRNYGDQKIT